MSNGVPYLREPPILAGENSWTNNASKTAGKPSSPPAPGTSDLKFITDPGLRANLRIDIGVITRALSNGEWKAATVLAGSVAEALLLWALNQKPPAAIYDAIAAARGSGLLTTKPKPTLEEWNLHEYIEVAVHLYVIKTRTAVKTRLAKNFRNFIHPGVAQRLNEKCGRATALSAVAGVAHIAKRTDLSGCTQST